MAVNEYEWQMLQQKTGWTLKDVVTQVDALIVTLGSQGSTIHTRDGAITIPCATPKAVVDPTGCGDAYRAGILHGLLQGLDWEDHRAGGLADGGHQDRDPGSPEPYVHAGPSSPSGWS